jgi:ribosomal protein S18 acetylase RimI-like enzyme
MTFSFQAPKFYQKIGYQVLGVYDGYSSGITESTLMKRLQPQRQTHNSWYQNGEQCKSGGLLITENVTEEEMKVVRDGLRRYVIEHAGPDWDKPGIPIRLVVKDRAGAVVGSLLAWTVLRNMILDAVWLDERYRRLGHGKALMLEAERIATENGCLACPAFCFSFHAPEFFRKLGYDAYGIANGYPDPIKEYLLIKRFQGMTAFPA